jgi:hypothetical protein
MDRDYVVDPLSKATVYATEDIKAEMKAYILEGISPGRQRELNEAMDCVVDARVVFELAKPKFRGQRRHFQSVKLLDLVTMLETNKDAAAKLKLKPALLQQVVARLKSLAVDENPSAGSSRVSSWGERGRFNSWDEESSVFDPSVLAGHDNPGVTEEETVTQADGKVRRRGTGYRGKMEKRTSTIKFTMPAEVDTEDSSKKWKENADGVEVSFSMFLMALQPILIGRILGKFPNRKSAVQQNLEVKAAFAEYLH